MTKQEYFELLVRSAYDGTFPSVDKNGIDCLYRGEGKKRCAIGLLIPDKMYSLDMEHKYGAWIFEIYSKEWIPEGMTVDNLCHLQKLHDESSEYWHPEIFVEALCEQEFFDDLQTEEIVQSVKAGLRGTNTPSEHSVPG